MLNRHKRAKEGNNAARQGGNTAVVQEKQQEGGMQGNSAVKQENIGATVQKVLSFFKELYQSPVKTVQQSISYICGLFCYGCNKSEETEQESQESSGLELSYVDMNEILGEDVQGGDVDYEDQEEYGDKRVSSCRLFDQKVQIDESSRNDLEHDVSEDNTEKNSLISN